MGEGAPAVMEHRDDLDPGCLFCRWIREGKGIAALGTVAVFEDGHPVTDGHLPQPGARYAAS